MTSGPPGSKYFGTETAPSAPVFSDYAARWWCGVQNPVPSEKQESCCDRDTRDLGSRYRGGPDAASAAGRRSSLIALRAARCAVNGRLYGRFSLNRPAAEVCIVL